jgi:hypothetical protein
MLTAEEYNAITGNRFSDDVRIAPAIKAASQAIRNYCSWHVAPSLACKLTTSVYDKRVTRVQDGVQIQLPAMFVSSITSIKVGGEDKPIYILDSNGMLLVMDVDRFADPTTPIEVEYIAGIADDAIKDLVASQVNHSVAQSYGVTSEASGGVSVTYNNAWAGGGQASYLNEYAREILAPYRLQGEF